MPRPHKREGNAVTMIDMLGVMGGLLLAELAPELRRQLSLRRTRIRPMQQINRRSP